MTAKVVIRFRLLMNIEGGPTYTQAFDAASSPKGENCLASVTVSGQTTQFVYDGDGSLAKKIEPDGVCTIYVGGVYEVEKATCGGAVTHTRVYYPAAGAMRVDGTLYYVLKDHLGSASVVTDASGNMVGEQRYYPFGETRFTSGIMFTDKLFTGQREMADLGIYHYGARFYSPTLGRFLSADTITPNPANPQDFNRYSYVRNSPLKYTDPTGHWVLETDDPVREQRRNANRHREERERNRRERERDNGGGGGGQPLPMPNPNPQCSPNLPGCNPIFSGTLSAQQLNTMSTNLTNLQSTLGHLSSGFANFGYGFTAGAGISAFFTPETIPLTVGLIVTAAVYGAASSLASNEAQQLGYLIDTVDNMETLAASSPENSINVYTSTHPEYSAPAINLTYEGANGVYIANSVITTLALLTSFPSD